MIAIMSPARNVRPVKSSIATTRPMFGKEAAQLADFLCSYDPWRLESLLDVPPERVFELYDDYRNFDAERPGAPALLAYYGAAFHNMSPQHFAAGDFAFAQQHLRILSAFYGMLRPLDGIVNHRLGLKKEFSAGGQSLYAFWGDKLYDALYRKDGAGVVVNLASMEYAKLITPYMRAGDQMVHCRFLVDKPGGARGTVATVRAARGLMVKYIVRNRITEPDDLRGFDEDHYGFVRARSTALEYVFVKRPWQDG